MATPNPIAMQKRLSAAENKLLPLLERVKSLELELESLKLEHAETQRKLNEAMTIEPEETLCKSATEMVQHVEELDSDPDCRILTLEYRIEQLEKKESLLLNENKCIKEFLKSAGKSDEERALAAVKEGNITVMKLLLDLNFDANKRYSENETLLFHAASYGNLEMVKLLIDYGASVITKSSSDPHPLQEAANFGHSEICEYLISCGASVNAVDVNGWSPLHLACFNGHENAVKVLLKHGADVTVTNKDTFTPREHAALMKRTSIINILDAHTKGFEPWISSFAC